MSFPLATFIGCNDGVCRLNAQWKKDFIMCNFWTRNFLQKPEAVTTQFSGVSPEFAFLISFIVEFGSTQRVLEKLVSSPHQFQHDNMIMMNFCLSTSR